MLNIQDINKLLEEAQGEGEVYLGRLSANELRETGFKALWEPEDEWWKNLEFVDIYLLYTDNQYALEYVFNGDPSDTYMEYERRLGEEYFNEALNSILKVLNASNTETADNGITNSDNQYMNYIDREVNDIINEYNLPNTEEIRKLVAMIIEEEIQKSIRDRLHSYIEKLTPEEMNVLILFHKPDYVKETYDEKLVCVMKERIPSELAYELQKKDLIDEYDIEGKRYYCIRWY